MAAVFMKRGGFVSGKIDIFDCDTHYLHFLAAGTYIPTTEEINNTLAGYPVTTLLGVFMAVDFGMDLI